MKEPSEAAIEAAFKAMSHRIWSGPSEELVGHAAIQGIVHALQAAYAIDFPEPQSPKEIDPSGHAVDFHEEYGNLWRLTCSCKASWTVLVHQGQPIGDVIQNSIVGHHISVGLKPSEVL